jgi:hypothetical protein
MMEGQPIDVDFSACDGVIADLDALEQAIVEICNINTVHAIQARKKVILKR